jgi:hypothetical protein
MSIRLPKNGSIFVARIQLPVQLAGRDQTCSIGHMRNIQKRFVVLLLAVSAMLAVLASRASMQADENRKVVVAFCERFFNQHDLSAADRYVGGVYIHHNPNVPSGRKEFVEGFAGVFAQFPQRHSQSVRAIAESGQWVSLL